MGPSRGALVTWVYILEGSVRPWSPLFPFLFLVCQELSNFLHHLLPKMYTALPQKQRAH